MIVSGTRPFANSPPACSRHAQMSRSNGSNLYSPARPVMRPKVDVRAAVFDDDDRVLMVRETSDGGLWRLPGGLADVNRTAAQNAVKEALEESGFEVEPLKLAPVWTARNRGTPRTSLFRLRADRWPSGYQPRDLRGRLVSRGERSWRPVIRSRPTATPCAKGHDFPAHKARRWSWRRCLRNRACQRGSG
jgi:ADP-ribose pyrophosphatase YjhB (NUDIX family)